MSVIVALDPDSKVCGFAVYQHGVCRECGCVKSKAKDPAPFRAMHLADKIESLCIRVSPEWVVIETPGKVRAAKTSVLSLQTQSMAVGFVARAAACGLDNMDRLVMVPADRWTGGRSKQVRARMHEAETGYKGTTGLHDVDARCLALWWGRELAISQAAAR